MIKVAHLNDHRGLGGGDRAIDALLARRDMSMPSLASITTCCARASTTLTIRRNPGSSLITSTLAISTFYSRLA